MERFKKITPTIAGISFILYALINLKDAFSAFPAVVFGPLFYVSFLAFGVLLLIKKTKRFHLPLLALTTLLSLLWLYDNIRSSIIILGLMSSMTPFQTDMLAIGAVLSGALRSVAFFILIYFMYRSGQGRKTVHWYLPALFFMLSGIVSIVFWSISGMLLPSNFVAMIIETMLLAYGSGAFAVSLQPNEE